MTRSDFSAHIDFCFTAGAQFETGPPAALGNVQSNRPQEELQATGNFFADILHPIYPFEIRFVCKLMQFWHQTDLCQLGIKRSEPKKRYFCAGTTGIIRRISFRNRRVDNGCTIVRQRLEEGTNGG